jgi:hypothetical protein
MTDNYGVYEWRIYDNEKVPIRRKMYNEPHILILTTVANNARKCQYDDNQSPEEGRRANSRNVVIKYTSDNGTMGHVQHSVPIIF